MILEIDVEDLILAFENHDGGCRNYLDLENGAIVTIMDDEDPEDSDLNGYSSEMIEDNAERFRAIPAIESRESFQIMEDFVLGLSVGKVQDRLSDALSRQRPFRSFKDELFILPKIQDQWYAFYGDRMKRFASEWLESEEIEAELVNKYSSESNL